MGPFLLACCFAGLPIQQLQNASSQPDDRWRSEPIRFNSGTWGAPHADPRLSVKLDGGHEGGAGLSQNTNAHEFAQCRSRYHCGHFHGWDFGGDADSLLFLSPPPSQRKAVCLPAASIWRSAV